MTDSCSLTGLGQLIAGLFAWAFLPNYSCTDPSIDPTAAPCTKHNNQGWRYVWYASGALVFVMSILRITVIRLKETPNSSLAKGKTLNASRHCNTLQRSTIGPVLSHWSKCKPVERLVTVIVAIPLPTQRANGPSLKSVSISRAYTRRKESEFPLR